jgi:hypothetical protein
MNVSPVPDGRDLDRTSGIVNEIQNAVVAATCGVSRRQRRFEGFSDTTWIVEQRPIDEFVSGMGDLFRKRVSQCAGRRSSDAKSIPFLSWFRLFQLVST